MKVLIVDDEKQLANAIVEILKKKNIDADAVYDGEDGYAYAMTGIYDVVVLDIMLPKLNGLEVLARLRKQNFSTPVIMLSAKSETEDKIEGLEIGADDYLTKPFDTGELLARLKALTRRKQDFTGDVLTFGDIELNKNTCSLSKGKRSIVLGGKEYRIMEKLLENPNVFTPKELLIEKIWGYDSDAEYNTVEVYVSFIRRKLHSLGSTVQIKALRNIGYRPEA